MRQQFETLNHYAPALTLLVLVGGLIWTTATRNAQFDALEEDLNDLQGDVEAVEGDVEAVEAGVRSVRETQGHMLACTIDLNHMQREGQVVEIIEPSGIVVDVPRTTVLIMPPLSEPESCAQARERTN